MAEEHVAEVQFYPEELKLVTEGTTVQVTWVTNATGIETVDARMEKWVSEERGWGFRARRGGDGVLRIRGSGEVMGLKGDGGVMEMG